MSFTRPQLFSDRAANHMAAFIEQRDQIGVFWHVLDCLREMIEMSSLDHSLLLTWGWISSQTYMTQIDLR